MCLCCVILAKQCATIIPSAFDTAVGSSSSIASIILLVGMLRGIEVSLPVVYSGTDLMSFCWRVIWAMQQKRLKFVFDFVLFVMAVIGVQSINHRNIIIQANLDRRTYCSDPLIKIGGKNMNLNLKDDDNVDA